MKKTGFIIGSIEVILGLFSLLITSLIAQVIPKIARICFMFHLGSFLEENYIINIGFANMISVCLCLIGVITIAYFVFIKKEQ
ncbi:hypothetical protein JYG23_07955 [Sedimentibacter sp. zth1]|uniref:hypothetical protein n=1 Tax=Sedimentibacter sp. zth1 TaxID=2816908 RepID=UPI001A937132|nr:hypothetical protein [Sedimentibacter sp. zth1]QSX04641.1 hypothetical protein JYG23_07955 [Sedimentibacter sp. zth1]